MWIDATFMVIEDIRYAVGYRHLCRSTEVDVGVNATFFSFRLHPKDRAGQGSDWIQDFKLALDRTHRIVIASADGNYAHLRDVGFMDCGGTKLLIELKHPAVKMISTYPRPCPTQREFYPMGFDDPKDVWSNAVLDEIGPSEQQRH